MSRTIVIDANNGFTAVASSGIVDALIDGFSVATAVFGADSNEYVQKSFAGIVALVTLVGGMVGGWLIGERTGAKKQREGRKLALESKAAFKKRAALPIRKPMVPAA